MQGFKFCSGNGQFHTNAPSKANRKSYNILSYDAILAMAAAPQRVDKSRAQWAIFSDQHGEHGRNAEHLRSNAYYGALWLDIDDNSPSMADVRKAADSLGCEYLLYSTKSTTETIKKWRVIIPLQAPINAHSFVLSQSCVNDILEDHGIQPDRATERVGQVCYLPNRGEVYEHHHHQVQDRLNIDALGERIAQKRQEAEQEKARQQQVREASIEKAQQRVASGVTSPIQAFNDSFSNDSLLNSYGYKKRGLRYLSPNSTSGVYGVTVDHDKNKWYSSHASDSHIGQQCAQGTYGDGFDLFVVYECGGDRSAAIKKAGAMFATASGETITQANQREYMRSQPQEEPLQEPLPPTAIYEEIPPPANKTNAFAQFENMEFMLETPPPPRDYLITDFLPTKIPFMLSGEGGTGKSYMALQMAICVAACDSFLGYEIKQNQGVLCVFAEDDSEELHRRLYSILDGLQADGVIVDMEKLRVNLKMVSAVGAGIRLIQSNNQTTIQTLNVNALTTVIKDNNINLAILDPLRTLTDGSENDNSTQNHFIHAIETIRNSTGCSIGLIHHTAKNAGNGARGASAFTDGVRLRFSLEKEDDGRVKLSTQKSNYTATGEDTAIFLSKELQDFGIYMKRSDEKTLENAELKQKVINAISENSEQGNFKGNTKRTIKERYKDFGTTSRKLRAFIEHLISQGEVIMIPPPIPMPGIPHILSVPCVSNHADAVSKFQAFRGGKPLADARDNKEVALDDLAFDFGYKSSAQMKRELKYKMPQDAEIRVLN